MNAFELYRFTHDDGSAKEWGYRDLGNGVAEIRWGPANQLRQFQEKPLPLARARSLEKSSKGYRYVGTVSLKADGSHSTHPQPTKTSVDIAALLGGGIDPVSGVDDLGEIGRRIISFKTR